MHTQARHKPSHMRVGIYIAYAYIEGEASAIAIAKHIHARNQVKKAMHQLSHSQVSTCEAPSIEGEASASHSQASTREASSIEGEASAKPQPSKHMRGIKYERRGAKQVNARHHVYKARHQASHSQASRHEASSKESEAPAKPYPSLYMRGIQYSSIGGEAPAKPQPSKHMRGNNHRERGISQARAKQVHAKHEL